MQMTKNLHKVTAVTLIIYMARKVHNAYMFLECFEACQVSELTTDFWPNERSLVAFEKWI